jgi:hypothetical protein
MIVNPKVGMRVRRASNYWTFYDQDCDEQGRSGPGTIITVGHEWHRVRWDLNPRVQSYRVSHLDISLEPVSVAGVKEFEEV